MNQIKKLGMLFGTLVLMASVSSCGYIEDIASKVGLLDVTAEDVVDRKSLKKFVLKAKERFEKNPEAALKEFKVEKEWNNKTIYLFLVSQNGISRFNAAFPGIRGQDLTVNYPFVEDLIQTAEAGGGYVEYNWDNPESAARDESKKVSYVVPVVYKGEVHVFGSGFYPSN